MLNELVYHEGYLIFFFFAFSRVQTGSARRFSSASESALTKVIALG
jgi:hypothetical protein